MLQGKIRWRTAPPKGQPTTARRAPRSWHKPLAVWAVFLTLAAGDTAFGQLSSGGGGRFPKLFEPQNASKLEAYVQKNRSNKVKQAAGFMSPTEMAGSVSSAFKKGFQKVSDAVAPKSPVPSGADSLSLSNDIKPGPTLYLAVARMHEQNGRLMQAEEQYRKALKLEPKHLESLVGYARLLDRRGRLNEALETYRRAARAYPQKAALQNDLGLCHARGGMYNEAVSAMSRAVELDPKRPLYRNNIATVLVDMGQVDAAMTHLRAVHGEAAAQYNLGYLLQKKGHGEAARTHFVKALQLNPSLAQARAWLDRLGPPRPQPVSRRPMRTQTVHAAPPGASPGSTPPVLSPRGAPRLRVSDRRMNSSVAPQPGVARGVQEPLPRILRQPPFQQPTVQQYQAPSLARPAMRRVAPPPARPAQQGATPYRAPAVYRTPEASGVSNMAPLPSNVRPDAPLPSSSGDLAPLPPTLSTHPSWR